MADAYHAEHLDGSPDALGPGRFAGVRGELQAALSRDLVHLHEALSRKARLITADVDGVQAPASPFDCRLRRFQAEVPLPGEAANKGRFEAGFRRSLAQSLNHGS